MAPGTTDWGSSLKEFLQLCVERTAESLALDVGQAFLSALSVSLPLRSVLRAGPRLPAFVSGLRAGRPVTRPPGPGCGPRPPPPGRPGSEELTSQQLYQGSQQQLTRQHVQNMYEVSTTEPSHLYKVKNTTSVQFNNSSVSTYIIDTGPKQLTHQQLYRAKTTDQSGVQSKALIAKYSRSGLSPPF